MDDQNLIENSTGDQKETMTSVSPPKRTIVLGVVNTTGMKSTNINRKRRWDQPPEEINDLPCMKKVHLSDSPVSENESPESSPCINPALDRISDVNSDLSSQCDILNSNESKSFMDEFSSSENVPCEGSITAMDILPNASDRLTNPTEDSGSNILCSEQNECESTVPEGKSFESSASVSDINVNSCLPEQRLGVSNSTMEIDASIPVNEHKIVSSDIKSSTVISHQSDELRRIMFSYDESSSESNLSDAVTSSNVVDSDQRLNEVPDSENTSNNDAVKKGVEDVPGSQSLAEVTESVSSQRLPCTVSRTNSLEESVDSNVQTLSNEKSAFTVNVLSSSSSSVNDNTEIESHKNIPNQKEVELVSNKEASNSDDDYLSTTQSPYMNENDEFQNCLENNPDLEYSQKSTRNVENKSEIPEQVTSREVEVIKESCSEISEGVTSSGHIPDTTSEKEVLVKGVTSTNVEDRSKSFISNDPVPKEVDADDRYKVQSNDGTSLDNGESSTSNSNSQTDVERPSQGPVISEDSSNLDEPNNSVNEVNSLSMLEYDDAVIENNVRIYYRNNSSDETTDENETEIDALNVTESDFEKNVEKEVEAYNGKETTKISANSLDVKNPSSSEVCGLNEQINSEPIGDTSSQSSKSEKERSIKSSDNSPVVCITEKSDLFEIPVVNSLKGDLDKSFDSSPLNNNHMLATETKDIVEMGTSTILEEISDKTITSSDKQRSISKSAHEGKSFELISPDQSEKSSIDVSSSRDIDPEVMEVIFGSTSDRCLIIGNDSDDESLSVPNSDLDTKTEANIQPSHLNSPVESMGDSTMDVDEGRINTDNPQDVSISMKEKEEVQEVKSPEALQETDKPSTLEESDDPENSTLKVIGISTAPREEFEKLEAVEKSENQLSSMELETAAVSQDKVNSPLPGASDSIDLKSHTGGLRVDSMDSGSETPSISTTAEEVLKEEVSDKEENSSHIIVEPAANKMEASKGTTQTVNLPSAAIKKLMADYDSENTEDGNFLETERSVAVSNVSESQSESKPDVALGTTSLESKEVPSQSTSVMADTSIKVNTQLNESIEETPAPSENTPVELISEEVAKTPEASLGGIDKETGSVNEAEALELVDNETTEAVKSDTIMREDAELKTSLDVTDTSEVIESIENVEGEIAAGEVIESMEEEEPETALDEDNESMKKVELKTSGEAIEPLEGLEHKTSEEVVKSIENVEPEMNAGEVIECMEDTELETNSGELIESIEETEPETTSEVVESMEAIEPETSTGILIDSIGDIELETASGKVIVKETEPETISEVVESMEGEEPETSTGILIESMEDTELETTSGEVIESMEDTNLRTTTDEVIVSKEDTEPESTDEKIVSEVVEPSVTPVEPESASNEVLKSIEGVGPETLSNEVIETVKDILPETTSAEVILSSEPLVPKISSNKSMLSEKSNNETVNSEVFISEVTESEKEVEEAVVELMESTESAVTGNVISEPMSNLGVDEDSQSIENSTEPGKLKETSVTEDVSEIQEEVRDSDEKLLSAIPEVKSNEEDPSIPSPAASCLKSLFSQEESEVQEDVTVDSSIPELLSDYKTESAEENKKPIGFISEPSEIEDDFKESSNIEPSYATDLNEILDESKDFEEPTEITESVALLSEEANLEPVESSLVTIEDEVLIGEAKSSDIEITARINSPIEEGGGISFEPLVNEGNKALTEEIESYDVVEEVVTCESPESDKILENELEDIIDDDDEDDNVRSPSLASEETLETVQESVANSDQLEAVIENDTSDMKESDIDNQNEVFIESEVCIRAGSFSSDSNKGLENEIVINSISNEFPSRKRDCASTVNSITKPEASFIDEEMEIDCSEDFPPEIKKRKCDSSNTSFSAVINTVKNDSKVLKEKASSDIPLLKTVSSPVMQKHETKHLQNDEAKNSDLAPHLGESLIATASRLEPITLRLYKDNLSIKTEDLDSPKRNRSPKLSSETRSQHSPLPKGIDTRCSLSPQTKQLEFTLKIAKDVNTNQTKATMSPKSHMSPSSSWKLDSGSLSPGSPVESAFNPLKLKISKPGSPVLAKDPTGPDIIKVKEENEVDSMHLPKQPIEIGSVLKKIMESDITEIKKEGSILEQALSNSSNDTPNSLIRKRGRPRKSLITSIEIEGNPMNHSPGDPMESPSLDTSGEGSEAGSSRQVRSCRARTLPIVVKTRKPRGGGVGRGGGRGGAKGVARPITSEKEAEKIQERLSEYEKAELAKIEARKEKLRLDRIAKNEAKKAKKLAKKLKDEERRKRIAAEKAEKAAAAAPQVFEEETRMSAPESRGHTPAPGSALARLNQTSETPEESQSSINAGSNINKKGRMEIPIDPESDEVRVDQLAEYQWQGSELCMIQEQVSLYLGVKSFKRKYPDLKRRTVEAEERTFLEDSGLVPKSMCDLGLTAVSSAEVLDVMYHDFPDKYEEFRGYMREKESRELSFKQKVRAPEKTKGESREQALEAAAMWNLNLNRERREDRRCSLDLQTFTVHYPKTARDKMARPALRPGVYPVSVIPGQFSDYYKTYTPTELMYFPLNTVMYGPLKPNERRPNHSDGSDSSSSSSDDSSASSCGSDSEDEESVSKECKICNGEKKTNSETHPEILLQCSQCKGLCHPTCQEITPEMLPHIKKYSWHCSNCKKCVQCKDNTKDEKMLFCDLCDRGYHLNCVGLKKSPEGRWHCSVCSFCTICGSKDPGGAEWHYEYKKTEKGVRLYQRTLCVPCSKNALL